MNLEEEEAVSWWEKAVEAVQMAQFGLNVSLDGAANRAYYAAFYAVSALLTLDGVEFKKHHAVESAVHRDLVNSGRWPKKLGKKYSDLFRLRQIGDYDNTQHVSREQASVAVADAIEILKAVHAMRPELFPLESKC